MAIITVYDLLEVSENASKEEIEKSYLKLVNTYSIDLTQSEEIRNQNELILKKLKLAYDILSDESKREKYDSDLAKKRAEELIKNVTVKEEPKEVKEVDEVKDVKEVEQTKPSITPNNVQDNIQNNTNKKAEKYEEESRSKIELTDVEKKKIKKAAEKELRDNLKKAQKAEEEYNKAYNEAYNDYLRKMGYSVKEPWTLKRFKNLVITIFAIIITCAAIWFLPPTRNILVQIYEENFIVKSLVDIVVMIFDAIISAFK